MRPPGPLFWAGGLAPGIAKPGGEEGASVRWVTGKNAKVDRIACPWLIRRFIDPGAEFLFVSPDEVEEVARRQAATPFDVAGVPLGHVGGCSFESILVAYGVGDPALTLLGRIVHGADIPEDVALEPESAGLRAIAYGFSLMLGDRDQEKLAAQTPMYDALYLWCRDRVRRGGGVRPAGFGRAPAKGAVTRSLWGGGRDAPVRDAGQLDRSIGWDSWTWRMSGPSSASPRASTCWPSSPSATPLGRTAGDESSASHYPTWPTESDSASPSCEPRARAPERFLAGHRPPPHPAFAPARVSPPQRTAPTAWEAGADAVPHAASAGFRKTRTPARLAKGTSRTGSRLRTPSHWAWEATTKALPGAHTAERSAGGLSTQSTRWSV